ncbi:MAG: molybdopterin biosynthesis protein [Nitrospira bacterium HGW-Nitrospira-1]|nr:MAG: molybdopterin biosynthesis protein [Nitrospira bacterium HGW-Nitrospira-1]
MRKNVYLNTISLSNAIRKWREKIESEKVCPLVTEGIPAGQSLGRITSEAIFAKASSPFYHASAMDGYAVKFTDTFGASERSPKKLDYRTQAVYVNTGDPMPDGFNSVIMVEDVNIIQRQDAEPVMQNAHEGVIEYIEIIQPATPWQHVRVIGEDIVCTELIAPENHKIRPVDIGALISGGHTTVSVRRKPKIVIIPTGSEIVEPGSALRKGNIIESNSFILSALVHEWGGETMRNNPVPDSIEEIKKAILRGCELGDLVVVNAGSSAGSADFTVDAIAELGEVIQHGINIKPGKPVILGWVKNTPVLGIPGYPVSAFITFSIFARILICALQGRELPEPEYITAKMSRQVASSLGQEEFLRVKLGKVGENMIATPLSRGAGILMSLVRADGFVRIPAMSEGIGAGAEVNVELLREKDEIGNTVVCIGSHDNSLDLLANILKKNHPGFSLSSAHVGSMGGLIALKKGEAHMAGTHLLDEGTGEYNVPYLQRLLGDRGIVLMNLVYRQQGLMVIKGNPKKIGSFEDLLREDIIFINRQGGSGTRLLTDKYLRENNISSGDIKGYDREEYTHMGAASAVLSGIADTGMGILAAARALDLDFIPLARERYDLAVMREYMNTGPVAAVLQIIRENQDFRTSVEKLGGYDVTDMGKIIYES